MTLCTVYSGNNPCAVFCEFLIFICIDFPNKNFLENFVRKINEKDHATVRMQIS